VSEPEELVELQHTQWDAIIDKLQQRFVSSSSSIPGSINQAARPIEI